MKILHSRSEFRKVNRPVFLAAGFFDGVHKGHRIVIDSAVARARETGGEAWVLTFDRHPLSVLAPQKSPPLLFPLKERLRLLEACGVSGVLLLPFTRRLALEEPESFVQALCDITHPYTGKILSEIRCGANWRFGRRAAGTPELLKKIGPRYGFTVVILPYAEYRGKEVSSTRIREAVATGELTDTSNMLGRPFSVRGPVIHGRGIGATQLSVATANLNPADFPVLPPCGVYATSVTLEDGTKYRAVTDFGVHPTFSDTDAKPLLETHLLDFQGNLYRKNIILSFLTRLREERAFPDSEALKRQLSLDIKMRKALPL